MVGKLNFISAGAGSGKTHRLTQILHEQLSSGAVRPSGVIATTFTNKAATELRERVRSHLLKQGEYGLANSMGQARAGFAAHGLCGCEPAGDGDGFTRRTFTAMVEAVREDAIRAGLAAAEGFDKGVADLCWTAEEDGVFCYTFFKARGANPLAF